MGNRLVLVHESINASNATKNLGIYIHWNDSQATVDALKDCYNKDVRNYENDPQYCIARMIDVLSKYYDGTTGLGVGIVSQLDTNNGDQGVWYFGNNFNIIKKTDGTEF